MKTKKTSEFHMKNKNQKRYPLLQSVWIRSTISGVFFWTETGGPQRSDGVQRSQKRLAHQPLWRAQAFPGLGDVCLLCPSHARLHPDLPRVSDHHVSESPICSTTALNYVETHTVVDLTTSVDMLYPPTIKPTSDVVKGKPTSLSVTQHIGFIM